jgi:hypothetical protein
MPAPKRKLTCEARQLSNTKFLSPYILSSISTSEAGSKDKESFESSQTRCMGWPTVSRRACSLALMAFTCTKVHIKITHNVGVEVQFKRYKVTSRSTGTFLHVASLHKGVQTAEVIPERCFPRAFGMTVYLHTVSAQSDSGMHK